MSKTIFDYTLEELKNLEYLNPSKKEFDSVIIVPMYHPSWAAIHPAVV